MPHFWDNRLIEVIISRRIGRLKIFLQLSIRQFIGFLVFTILCSIFLDSIIREMYKRISGCFKVEFR